MIKICGITNREDALAAVEAGATALGFNFYARSPRFVRPELAAEIGAGLPVLKVGVFVDDPDASTVAERACMDVIQAFRVTPEWDSAMLSLYNAEAFLLDGPTPGSGEAFDWTRASGLRNIILAGGLGPDNVADAIYRVRPWGVDACSRLERARCFCGC